MGKPLVLPQLGLNVQEARLSAWLVRDGDQVVEGEEVAEVTTDKSTVSLVAPASGRIRMLARLEEVIPVGGRLAEIVAPGESDIVNTAQSVSAAPVVTQPAALASTKTRIQASPRVRKQARDLGVDIRVVHGSGPAGRVMPDDVNSAAQSATPGVPSLPSAALPSADPNNGSDYVEIPLSGIRKLIADNLRWSLTQTAQVTATMEVDCTQLAKLKSSLQQRKYSVSFNDLISRILIKVLKSHSRLNGTVIGDSIREYHAVHLGIAVDLDSSTVVPVLRHADRMRLLELAAAAHDLVSRLRAGRLRSEENSGSTFTISNTGNFSVDAFTPILNPPEIALLGLGGIRDKVYPINGRPEVRTGVTACLTYDHRAVDGVAVARFMSELKTRLESASVDLASELN